ncbi:hypothetical protein LCGC14_0673740 [marine sediment metagenome]|uniref:Uncharacterized protein n=1 Tax=marine sediment metagenome TaxID=412755 RepID=A0A0F9TBP6_9ZZZZ
MKYELMKLGLYIAAALAIGFTMWVCSIFVPM